MLVIITYLFFIQFASGNSFSNKNCSYDFYPDSPTIYIINQKRSVRKLKHMTQLLTELKLNFHKIDAINFNSAYFPDHLIQSNSDKTLRDICKYRTSNTFESSVQSMQQTNKTQLISGLCTSSISFVELYNTMSHLKAIYTAVHSTTTKSKYAVIMEDNIHMSISTDFSAIAESAPRDFGILQLMTTSPTHIPQMCAAYAKDATQLWTKRTEDMWSAGLYLINREKMRPIIDSIVRVDPVYPDIMQYTLIAAKTKGTVPAECSTSTPSLACIDYDRVVPDGFIYSLLPTYTLQLPIAYAGSSPKSTTHSSSTSLPELEKLTTACLASTVNKPSIPYDLACVDQWEKHKISSDKPRILYILTCETRSEDIPTHWKDTMPALLRDDSIRGVNMCTRRDRWLSFLWKYSRLLKTLRTIARQHEDHLSRVHVVFADADTFWSNPTVSSLWDQYDRARGSKHLVVSSEMNCWVGNICSDDVLRRLYSNFSSTPSHSPFLNSGFIMGSASSVLTMATYIVKHSDTWQPFDDQHAVSDYALRLRPEEVVLDYHQNMCGSFLVVFDPLLTTVPIRPSEMGFQYVCKGLDGAIKRGCFEWEHKDDGTYFVDNTTCALQRYVPANKPLYSTLKSLAPVPILWHGKDIY